MKANVPRSNDPAGAPISRADLRLLFDRTRSTHRGAEPSSRDMLIRLGPLERTFERFLDHEERIEPHSADVLIRILSKCTDVGQKTSREDVARALEELRPGGMHVGHVEVVLLTEAVRDAVTLRRKNMAVDTKLPPHGSAFGSGGDLHKTPHATTEAALLVSSPDRRFCKTGTGHVTSFHGSERAIRSFGYRAPTVGNSRGLAGVDDDLRRFGFSFVSMRSLGVPYSPALRDARRAFWRDGTAGLDLPSVPPVSEQHEALAHHDIPIDIFKVISPNAMPLDPVHHSTGVHHLSLVPYVLAIYLHRGMTGLIVHGYDGIDELSPASSNMDPESPTGLVIQVREDDIRIVETYPEQLGLARSPLTDLTHNRGLRKEAREFRDIVAGRAAGPSLAHRNLVVANAAALLVAAEATTTYRDAGLTDALRDGCRRTLSMLGTPALMERMDALSRRR